LGDSVLTSRFTVIIEPMKTPELDLATLDRVIQMAWEDRTPFEAIALQFGLNESNVIALMRKHMKRSSFQMWRKRVAGRSTKHRMLRVPDVTRFRSDDQRTR
jgi:uncharacterized protein (TIGR03643 family)